MSPELLIVVLQLMLETSATTPSTSTASHMKTLTSNTIPFPANVPLTTAPTIDLSFKSGAIATTKSSTPTTNTARSSSIPDTTASRNTGTATALPILDNTKSASNTTVLANTTTTAFEPSARSVISSIRTFDFSKSKLPKVQSTVNTCSTKNMCLEGFCIRGRCVTKKCSTEIICICDPGFTGQFCDKNSTEVEKKNGIAHGKLDTTPKNKHHVNGNINHNLLTPDNGNNGDQNVLKSDNGNGNVDNGNGYNGNGRDKYGIQTQNGQDNGDNGSSHGGIGHKNKENGNGHEGNGNKNKNNGNKNGGHIKGDNGIHVGGSNKHGKESVNATGTGINKVIGGSSKIPENVGTSVTMLSPESYVKGPEVHAPSVNSAIQFDIAQSEIRKKPSALVNKQADVVTVSTVSVEKTRVGMTPEMLAFIFNGAVNSNRVKSGGKISTPKQISKLKENPNLVETSTIDTSKDRRNTARTSNSKRTIKEKLHMLSPPEKKPQLEIVSNADVVKGKQSPVSETTGSVIVLNNTVEANNVFANSEIKITIETSDAGMLFKDTGVAQNNINARKKEHHAGDTGQLDSNLNKRMDITLNTPNKQRLNLNTSKEAIQTTPGKTRSNTKKPKPTEDIVSIETTTPTTATRITELTKNKATGASHHLESRKRMKSIILNPFIQLMNLFGSEKFAEKVSAIKIEIITKQNSTSIQNKAPKDSNRHTTNAVDINESKTQSRIESKVDKSSNAHPADTQSSDRVPL